ncbi:RAD51-associated protein 1-like [Lineus longissimus]|uniref:RAD51-associated protein 1-like n=1 Tax=Lineus longissimus TaxID=88925 RepID=UPI002B4D603B
MAEVGRARRARKVIDYANFADGDESDDDFVSSSTPPVAKRPKLDKPDKSSKSTKTEKENVKKKKKKSLNRKPPGENLFETHLQAALELSMIETSSQETAESQESVVKDVLIKPVVIADDDEIVCLGSEPIQSMSPVRSSCRAASKEQRQSFLQESESEGPSQDNNEEFKLEGDESEDDEDDESDDSFNPDDDDSDFDDGKKKKKKPPAKPRPQKTPKTAASTTSHPKPKTVCKPSPAPFRSPIASNSLPATNTPKSDLGTCASRKPAWTPPAPTGSATKCVNLGGRRSPSGGGGLRLGLSRSQRVKPLHSSVKGAR